MPCLTVSWNSIETRVEKIKIKDKDESKWGFETDCVYIELSLTVFICHNARNTQKIIW